MMTSFYNLLKYAKTGLASPDMTYYDKMRASMLMGGAVQTLTGQPPLSFKADGSPLISWSMKGNGSQSGTPTPDNPMMPEFVGVRTGNLFDKSTITSGKYATLSGTAANNYYYCSDFIPITAATYYFQNVVGGSYQNTVVVYDANKQGLRYAKLSGGANVSGALTFQSGDAYIRVNFYHQTDVDTVMLNLGSTALPYEPYGWAEKITCAGQTTPLYLGEVSTVRRIKKLVLTGEEVLQLWKENYYSSIIDRKGKTSAILCTHLINSNEAGISYDAYSSFGLKIAAAAVPFVSSVNDLKAWLAAQYAAGHPVTVWYVLASETTGIVNEPLMKIGDYSDTLTTDTPIPTAKGSNELTVDTTVQPSEMSITYRG